MRKRSLRVSERAADMSERRAESVRESTATRQHPAIHSFQDAVSHRTLCVLLGTQFTMPSTTPRRSCLLLLLCICPVIAVTHRPHEKKSEGEQPKGNIAQQQDFCAHGHGALVACGKPACTRNTARELGFRVRVGLGLGLGLGGDAMKKKRE